MIHRITLLALTAVTCFALLRCSTTTPTNAPAEGDAGASDDAEPGRGDAPPAETCPATQASTVLGTVTSSAINEASGIAASKQNAGVFWVHNDSGDSARAFAVGSDGTLRATVAFDTTKPTDIEDMAIEDDGNASHLYFADIGDNHESRASLTIHRVAEPKLGNGAAVELTALSEKMSVTYPDGAHNAETLLFDPIDKVLVIVTKKAGGPAAFHRVGKFSAGGKATTEKIAEYAINLATGGEISRDGRYIAVRDYAGGYLWLRRSGESLQAALAKQPCKIPMPVEPQGEAFAFLVDGSGYITTSEGLSPALNVTRFK